jgi:hypothetical protein
MSRRVDVLGAVVLIACGVALLLSLQETPRVPVTDPLGPFGVPRVAAALIVVLGITLLFPGRPAPADPDDPDDSSESAVEVPDRQAGGLPRWVKTTVLMVATGLYVVGFDSIGFVPSTVLLGLVLLPVLGAGRRLMMVAPVVLTAVLWYVFAGVMDVRLPPLFGE